MRRCKLAWVLLLLGAGLTACSASREEIVPERFQPRNAHEEYAHSLEQADLAETALGRDWLVAATEALTDATVVPTPFQEVLYIDPFQVFSVGYRFRARRGQRIEVDVELSSPQPLELFVDLFRRQESSSSPEHVASAEDGNLSLEFEPGQDQDYILRLQSELMRSGRCRVTIRRSASLEFPVAGHSTAAIGSVFGAPHDAGRRRHHGVDIFAPRHTPVIAPASAIVMTVSDSGMGGKIVWMRDSRRSLDFYFAHLESQSVREGTPVSRGDVIGTVGNTGNARTTYPHLHFGVYSHDAGPVDPYHFIVPTRGVLRESTVDPEKLGTWARTGTPDVSLRKSPDLRLPARSQLVLHTPVQIVGATRRLYRVLLPDRSFGFVTRRGVVGADRPLGINPVRLQQAIFDAPAASATAIGHTVPGDRIPVLGNYGKFLFVRTESGRTGWMATD